MNGYTSNHEMRRRGWLTTKTHLACEQGRKLLSLALTARRRADCPQFTAALEAIQTRYDPLLLQCKGFGACNGRSPVLDSVTEVISVTETLL
ncbi:hypothetical protein [Nocardia sp. CA-119907]|uniref:hypothetical protein n=1 Tax=Nocardia sp. CA-119907 TaxID=3239973 RepID=UPI003D97AC02